MEKQRLFRTNAGDYVIAAAVIVLSMLPIILFAGIQGSTAELRDSGVLKLKLNLDKSSVEKYRNMEIETDKGRVRIKKSDCPRQICSHTGWISARAQTIVCVPNRVIIEIKGGGGSVNAVAY